MDGIIFYKKVYEAILSDIENEVFPPNSYLPYEKELCDKYDVSLITVRRALKLLEANHFIIKIKGKGSFVNPNLEINTSAELSTCFGVLFFGDRNGICYDEYYNYSNLWSAKIYSHLFTKIKNDYTLVFETMYQDEVIDKFKNQATILKHVDRILLLTYGHVECKILDYLKEQGKQLIIYNYFNQKYEICNVLSNEREIYYQLVLKLFKLNHQKIAFMNGMIENQYCDNIERFMGYQEAFISHGHSLVDNLIKWTKSPRDAYYKMKEVLELPEEQWPTAVVCINDGIALGVYEAIKEKGLRIPEDISVVGHDNDDVSLKMEPPLTTIDPLYYKVADAIAGCFERKIWNKNDRIYVKGKLIMRNSLAENLTGR